MKLLWHPLARHDIVDLVAFISEDNPKAARAMVQRIRKAAKMLCQHPGLGRPGRVLGSRELVVSGTPYILPYRVDDDGVEILRVYHAARQWPDRF